MSGDKHTDNDEDTKHTGQSWAGLEDGVDCLKLKLEEVLNVEVYWKPDDNRLKNIPNIRTKKHIFVF